MTTKVETLEKLLETVKQLKEVSRGTVGVGVTKQFDEVIAEIESLIGEGREQHYLPQEALKIVGKLLDRLPLIISILDRIE